jgi:hypothetical protein
MASRTVVTVIDDLNGKVVGDDGRRVTFSFDGVDYQIDLGGKNLTRLEKALGPYIAAATRTGDRRTTSRRRVKANEDKQAIRQWARDNGYPVSDRGRISADVLSAWNGA